MKWLISGDPSTQAVFTWARALWSVVLAGLTFGLYCLSEYRILSEEQIMLLIFVAVPMVAFFISGKGQDRSAHPPKTTSGHAEPVPPKRKN